MLHLVRKSRGACVVAELLGGHRPAIWVSDLYGAQQGHAAEWLAHQLRDCQFAIEAGDAVFAPRMKALLLRAVAIARRRGDLAESTRREYRRRPVGALDAVMALAPKTGTVSDCARRYGKVRDHLFTFLDPTHGWVTDAFSPTLLSCWIGLRRKRQDGSKTPLPFRISGISALTCVKAAYQEHRVKRLRRQPN